MATNDDVFNAALRLPAEERARLAHELIASLDADAGDDDGVEAAWTAEIARRAQDVASAGVSLEDGDAVHRRVADRLRSRK